MSIMFRAVALPTLIPRMREACSSVVRPESLVVRRWSLGKINNQNRVLKASDERPTTD